MTAHIFFLHLMAILIAARLFAELAVRLQVPAVIGELLAGVVLGPSVLGWLDLNDPIRLLAEIGIIMLLFEVGLETDVGRLIATGLRSLWVATLGFVAPFVLGFAISYWLFDLSLLAALFVGGTLTATSIGITVRVLTDLKRLQSREAQVVLGAAVLDDVMGVVLLAVLYEFYLGGGINLVNAGKVALFVGIFFILAPLMAKLISLLIKRVESATEIPGLIPTAIVALVLFFAWLAHAIGAPELLGGFAAGLALSRRFFFPLGVAIRADPDFAHRIEGQMSPIIHLFTPIFFVSVGLSLNLREIDWSSTFIWTFSLSVFALAMLGKLIGGVVSGEKGLRALIVGLAMSPRGEVGLIFAELGRTSGIMNAELYAATVIVIVFTTFLPPLIIKGLYRRYGQILDAPP